MSKINQENQGMLKMLQDISILLKDGKRIKASQIREKTGLELKYWVKLRNNHLIVDDGKSCNRPIYKWNTINPNINMAIKTLKDVPDYKPTSKPNTNYKIEVFDKVSKIDSQKTIPPNIKWVKEYCALRRNHVNPDKWFAHYESVDWMVGKNKMKNWKAAIHNWEQPNYNTVYVNKPLTDTEFIEDFKKRDYLISDQILIGIFKKRGFTGNISKDISL